MASGTPPAMPCEGHSPTATCADTAGWLGVSAQRWRSWTPRTPRAPSSTSFTSSNSRPRGAPASTTCSQGPPSAPSHSPHPGEGSQWKPLGLQPSPGEPGWAWWLWGKTGRTFGPMHLAGEERKDWGDSGGAREGQSR